MYLAFDMATWAWPQWVYFCVMMFNVIFAAILHGQPKNQDHSFPVAVTGSAIGLFILSAGGFFA